MKLKLLKAYDTYAADEIVEVGDDIGPALIAAKVAEAVDPADVPEGVQLVARDAMKAVLGDLSALVKASVDDAVKSLDIGDKRIDTGGVQDDDGKGGFKSLGHFAHDIWKVGRNGQNVSETLAKWCEKVAGHAEEGDNSQGGYLTPTTFRATLLQKQLEESVVQNATMVPMETNTVSIPYINETTHVGSVHGGITPARTVEMGQKTATKPTFGLLTLQLRKITGLVFVTDELMEDSAISMEPLMNKLFTDAINFQADDDYLFGTGVGMSLGAFVAPCTIAQAIEPLQPAATVVAMNIVNMWSRLNPRSAGRAVWLCNMGVFPQLATMGIAVGAGGGPVFMPANGLAGSPYASLMGRPLIITEHMQALGTQGDIGLADFSEYLIGQKAGGGVATATSIHLRFDYDETAFRFVLRTDGQPWWPAPMTPLRGGAGQTYSPFVVLAARP